MPYNKQHHVTFVALLKLWGLAPQVAEPIGRSLAQLENSEQDQLLAVISDELHKSKIPPQVEHNS